MFPGRDHLSIGIGMVPRGEVGLIFRQHGHDPDTRRRADHIAVDLLRHRRHVIVTTMATPPALTWSLSRKSREPEETKE